MTQQSPMIRLIWTKHQTSGVRTAVMDSLQPESEQKGSPAQIADITGYRNEISIKENISFRL